MIGRGRAQPVLQPLMLAASLVGCARDGDSFGAAVQGSTGQVLVGTDVGVLLAYPGSSVHEEMQLLVEAGGLTPHEALRGATRLTAVTIRRPDVSASIAVGQRADLVLLAADPLENIRNSSRIDAVILNGRLFRRADIQRLIEAAERLALQRQ